LITRIQRILERLPFPGHRAGFAGFERDVVRGYCNVNDEPPRPVQAEETEGRDAFGNRRFQLENNGELCRVFEKRILGDTSYRNQY